MFLQFFLPEKFGAHRIISQRIVGISIHDDCVRLVLTHAKQNKTLIEKVDTKQIEPGDLESLPARVSQAIKKLLEPIKSYDQIRISIPASIVIFKDLTLPLTDPDKIRMVLDYEIEPMLPFSIHEATIDFIVTKTQKDPQQISILVAAVRNQDLQAHLSLYTNAGIDPSSITIDLFALYGLYQQIPDYKDLSPTIAFAEIGQLSTRVAFIQNGQLRLARYIQRGLSSIIKLASNETKVDIKEIENRLYKQGIRNVGSDDAAKSLQKHFVLLLNDIQFTLNSFSLKLNFYDGVSKILFTGNIDKIIDAMPFCTDTMQIPCEIFDCSKIFTSKAIKDKTNSQNIHWNDYTVTLGTAVSSLEQHDFDLRRKQFALKRNSLIIKQAATAGFIILALLITLGIKSYFDLNSLANEARTLEQQEISKIKAEGVFPKDKFPKKPNLSTIVRDAEKIVREKLEIWAPFAQQRMRPLELWLELTQIINKKQFDVTIKEIIITTEEKNWERDKDGSIKKDLGVPKIEVEGLFKSKTAGSHFADFKIFEDRFKESTLLKLIEPQTETTPALGDGVNFIIRMKLKEE